VLSLISIDSGVPIASGARGHLRGCKCDIFATGTVRLGRSPSVQLSAVLGVDPGGGRPLPLRGVRGCDPREIFLNCKQIPTFWCTLQRFHGDCNQRRIYGFWCPGQRYPDCAPTPEMKDHRMTTFT
jgi:hypothetical protein